MQQQMEYWLGKASEGEARLAERFAEVDRVALFNQQKILESFWQEQVADFHLHGSTGYGYGDEGRDTLDRVYAHVFHAQKALVRAQFVSGTHAIGTAIYGAVAPGDEILSITGAPYDTLEQLLGIKGSAPGNLRSLGVTYRQVELTTTGEIDLEAVKSAIRPRTRLVLIQRSRGYSWRPSQTIDQIGQAIAAVKAVRPDLVVFVDNCYGELTELREPTDVGADLIAGSLIKNLGGGLAPSGGYIVGRDDLVEAAANRLTMPGLGSHMGASLGDSQRLTFQGLFLAPHVVGQALKGMHLLGYLLEQAGYEVSPYWSLPRTDIIQAVRFPSAEPLISFCQSIQKSSPVDAHVVPEPWAMPGYLDPVIMAAGTFVQGASIELSADAPIRAPFTAYIQGGLTYEHVKLAAARAMAAIAK